MTMLRAAVAMVLLMTWFASVVVEKDGSAQEGVEGCWCWLEPQKEVPYSHRALRGGGGGGGGGGGAGGGFSRGGGAGNSRRSDDSDDNNWIVVLGSIFCFLFCGCSWN